ncbi:MAG TPA: hypothetical protein VG245_05825 [Candidatus Dormibacteraeota bacterium]|jgi:hypothetical protein|nr:hypothetical protein [Candidatus Dormibacteraeota bacterium]
MRGPRTRLTLQVETVRSLSVEELLVAGGRDLRQTVITCHTCTELAACYLTGNCA